jgi:hypothetical protein
MIHQNLDAIGHPTSPAEINELNRVSEKRKINESERSK